MMINRSDIRRFRFRSTKLSEKVRVFRAKPILPRPKKSKILRRKAQILEMLYEMSKTLGTVFDLKEIFLKATDLIFRGTPAERVVALLADETIDGKILDYSLYPIAVKGRDENMENLSEKLSISRTITQKVMREKVALFRRMRRPTNNFWARNQLFRKACVQRFALL